MDCIGLYRDCDSRIIGGDIMTTDLIDIDYDNISSEEAERLLRSAGYDPKLVGKYYALVAENTFLKQERDYARKAAGEAEIDMVDMGNQLGDVLKERDLAIHDIGIALMKLKSVMEERDAALERERVLREAVDNLIDYRDRVSALGFQLEKADDYIDTLRQITRTGKEAQL